MKHLLEAQSVTKFSPKKKKKVLPNFYELFDYILVRSDYKNK